MNGPATGSGIYTSQSAARQALPWQPLLLLLLLLLQPASQHVARKRCRNNWPVHRRHHHHHHFSPTAVFFMQHQLWFDVFKCANDRNASTVQKCSSTTLKLPPSLGGSDKFVELSHNHRRSHEDPRESPGTMCYRATASSQQVLTLNTASQKANATLASISSTIVHFSRRCSACVSMA